MPLDGRFIDAQWKTSLKRSNESKDPIIGLIITIYFMVSFVEYSMKNAYILIQPERYRSSQYDSFTLIELKLDITANAKINAPAPYRYFKLVVDIIFLRLFIANRIMIITKKIKNTPDRLIRRVGS